VIGGQKRLINIVLKVNDLKSRRLLRRNLIIVAVDVCLYGGRDAIGHFKSNIIHSTVAAYMFKAQSGDST
jgi:hypothetical protein